MPYLGGFMRGGSPDYDSNPGILGLYQFVQSGYDAGKAKAQNQALAQLSQKAYTDTGDAQKQDISQAIGIDPQAGYQLAGMAQQQQAAQQAQQQQILARYGKAASAILAAKQRGDDATAEGIYQAIVPELGLLSVQHGGPTPPPTLQGADMGALYKLAAMYGQMPQDEKGVVVSQGGSVVNPYTGKEMYNNPAAPKIVNGMAVSRGANGEVVASPVPITGAGAPAQTAQSVGASPQNAPGFQGSATSPAGQTVSFDFPPGTPPEVIAAAKAAAVANGDLAQGQQSATTLSDTLHPKGSQSAPSGYQWNADHTALQPIPGGPADKGDAGFNANTPQPIGDPKLTGDARLQSIDPDNKATVLAVLQGRKAPPTGTASKSSYWMGVIQAANAIDPTFDETSWPARVKTAQAYAPSGAQGQQIIALNTLINHVGELDDQFKSLNNTGSPLYNSIANKIAYETGLGAKGLPAYNINAHAAAQEIETLWKKGGGNEADIKRYSDALSSSNSPAQQAQVIEKMLKLAYGRLQSLQSNYQNSMGIAGNGLNFVNNKSEGVIQSLAPDLAGEYQSGSSALPSGAIAAGQQPQQSAPTSGWSIEEVH